MKNGNPKYHFYEIGLPLDPIILCSPAFSAIARELHVPAYNVLNSELLCTKSEFYNGPGGRSPPCRKFWKSQIAGGGLRP